MERYMHDRNKIAGAIFLRGIRLGLLTGIVTGAVLGFPIFVIGAIFGAFIGGYIGVFVGMGMGVVAGIITVLFFYPLTNLTRYRIVMGVASVIGSATFAYIGSLLTNGAP